MKNIIYVLVLLIASASCTKQDIKPYMQKEEKKTRHHYIKFKCTLGFGSGCWTYIGMCHGRLEHNIGGLNVAEWKMYDIVEDVELVEINGCKTIMFSKDGDIYKKAVNNGKLYIGEISIEESLDIILPANTYDIIEQGNYAYIKN